MIVSDTATRPVDRAPADERTDLLETLATHRGFLLRTVHGLTDEQASRRTTVSELCLGGLVKHVAAGERQWVDFIETGPAAMATTADNIAQWAGSFHLLPGETLAAVLEQYAAVASRTAALVAALPDLDMSQPLPPAPWFAPGARWSARRVLLHIIAETAQHAGHADILRESFDGKKTMG